MEKLSEAIYMRNHDCLPMLTMMTYARSQFPIITPFIVYSIGHTMHSYLNVLKTVMAMCVPKNHEKHISAFKVIGRRYNQEVLQYKYISCVPGVDVKSISRA